MKARFSRRAFIKLGAAGGAALFLPWRFGPATARAQIPGPTLPPGSIPKYATPLLVPPAMPRAGKLKVKGGGKNIDYYEIAVRQFQQQILPPGRNQPSGATARGSRRTLIFNAPSLTIEAKHGTPVRVKWVNEREDPADPTSAYLPTSSRSIQHCTGRIRRWDGRPRHAAGIPLDARPTGPVPIVTHVHGSAGVGDESDGYAKPGPGPRPATSPSGYATEGTWYDFFQGKAASRGYVAPARPSGTRERPSSSIPTASARQRSGTTTTRWG